MGEYRIAKESIRLSCIGLGSCVAIAISDAKHTVGALAHTMLPVYDEGLDKGSPGKYTDMAIYLIVDELLAMDMSRYDLKAKIMGGAQMFQGMSPEPLDIGARNIESAIQTLRKERIPLVARHVGGSKGRSIWFDVRTGAISVQVARGSTITI
jgi:chemotaxis protein CheD